MNGRRERFSFGQGRSSPRTGAATAAADAESGTEPADVERDLYALKVLRDRGLIPPEEYEARRRELTGTASSDGHDDPD